MIDFSKDIKKAPPQEASLVVVKMTDEIKGLSEFLDQPLPKIAEAITGALASSKSDLLVAGGRIAQGALKGIFLKQTAREISRLIEKGKIPEDYSTEKFGFKTFSELLRFIDEEDVDEDRLFAVKAMFYTVNKIDQVPGEELLSYQLFQLSKKLTASQIVLLTTTFRTKNDGGFEVTRGNAYISHQQWLDVISTNMGHGVITLISQDAKMLVEMGFLAISSIQGGSFIWSSGGLTDLGQAFCEKMHEYSQVMAE